MSPVATAILSVIAGLVIGIVVMLAIDHSNLNSARAKSKELIDEAQSKADTVLSRAKLEGQQKAYDMKLKAEEEIKAEKSKMQAAENKLLRKEDSLNFREENLSNREKKLNDKNRQIDDRLAKMARMEEEKQNLIEQQQKELERISHLSEEDAHKELMETVSRKFEKETAQYLHDQEEEAENQAAANARNIIAAAIHRVAQDETIERTVSTVTLPSEDMKGRIIGREGRNI